LTINPINDAPIPVTDSRSTSEDMSLFVTVLVNDSDPENDTLTVTDCGIASNGAVVVS
jgi:hypothetical protein